MTQSSCAVNRRTAYICYDRSSEKGANNFDTKRKLVYSGSVREPSRAAEEEHKVTRKYTKMISYNAYRKTPYEPSLSPLPPPRPPKPDRLKYKYSNVPPPIHPRRGEAPPSTPTKWKPTPFPRLSLLKRSENEESTEQKPAPISLHRPIGVAYRFPMSSMAVNIDASPSTVAQRTSPGSKDSGLTHSGSSGVTEERSFDDDFVRRIKRWDSRSSRSDTRTDKNASFETPSTSNPLQECTINNDFFDTQGLDAELMQIEQERLRSLQEEDEESLSNFTSITNQRVPSDVGNNQPVDLSSPLAHFNANAKLVSPMEKNMRVLQWIHCCKKAQQTSSAQ
uniref:FAM110_C domain-containing protein n=1 Tax=Steinernema glaseri TaxID=37863 RepID=A0A1I8A6Y9_9BILA